MHVFIGGAHNGKREYVRKWLTSCEKTNFHWLDGVNPFLETIPQSTIVLAGIENWVIETGQSEKEIAKQLLNIRNDKEIIFILTDIGRGIVPIDANERKRRDVCGRIYQYLISEANHYH